MSATTVNQFLRNWQSMLFPPRMHEVPRSKQGSELTTQHGSLGSFLIASLPRCSYRFSSLSRSRPKNLFIRRTLLFIVVVTQIGKCQRRHIGVIILNKIHASWQYRAQKGSCVRTIRRFWIGLLKRGPGSFRLVIYLYVVESETRL
jgi:hypothetical protein